MILKNKAADYLKVSAKNGGYFICIEQNNGSMNKNIGKRKRYLIKIK